MFCLDMFPRVSHHWETLGVVPKASTPYADVYTHIAYHYNMFHAHQNEYTYTHTTWHDTYCNYVMPIISRKACT